MHAALCVAVICRMVGRSYMLLEAVNRGTSPRNFFHLHFSVSYQDGLSWYLRALHCKFQVYKDCRPGATMCFFLAQISLTSVANAYVHI